MIATTLTMIAAAAAAQPSPATPPRLTSAYTRLDLDRCKRVDGGEPQSATWRCTGYSGVPLIVESGDDRYDVDAGRADSDEFWGESFDYPGDTVEWRLHRGEPFAIIYRLTSSGDGRPNSSRLIVETIGRGAAGCRIAAIDGAAKDANALARQAADRALSGKARCLKAL